ncbi:Zinc finger protein VAR3, chloroplastic [Portunus trituberculatus]|uniref:Zinc finger protein VAR3, chloroplastic n=1 Tax=Portunus trituberculatus TaxID=210409 RepID=A0A5B7FD34_PORTR|nr:Zinc finger protein VAR3, chloroplastic [Portunus trituberculatus]
MEDTKDSNDWGGESEREGWGDRYSDHDSGSRDRYSSRSNVKPGDWDCPSCQFSNFASRTACFKCRTPKDGDSFGSGGRMGGGGGGGIRDMRPGDWMCPKCQFHNFSSRGMCYKCNSPRGGLCGEASGKCSCQAAQGGDTRRGSRPVGVWGGRCEGVRWDCLVSAGPETSWPAAAHLALSGAASHPDCVCVWCACGGKQGSLCARERHHPVMRVCGAPPPLVVVRGGPGT